MSGYDDKTGWTHFTTSKWHRYIRSEIVSRSEIETRFDGAEVEFYWDASDGIHAHCDEAFLWEILSGEPAVFGVRSDPQEQTEWLSVTDLGANFVPPRASSTVLASLRRIGMLERTNGKNVPTSKAQGLYEERPAGETVRFESRPGAIQRRWAFAVLELLSDEDRDR